MGDLSHYQDLVHKMLRILALPMIPSILWLIAFSDSKVLIIFMSCYELLQYENFTRGCQIFDLPWMACFLYPSLISFSWVPFLNLSRKSSFMRESVVSISGTLIPKCCWYWHVLVHLVFEFPVLVSVSPNLLRAWMGSCNARGSQTQLDQHLGSFVSCMHARAVVI